MEPTPSAKARLNYLGAKCSCPSPCLALGPDCGTLMALWLRPTPGRGFHIRQSCKFESRKTELQRRPSKKTILKIKLKLASYRPTNEFLSSLMFSLGAPSLLGLPGAWPASAFNLLGRAEPDRHNRQP